jgi:hypothetical protein
MPSDKEFDDLAHKVCDEGSPVHPKSLVDLARKHVNALNAKRDADVRSAALQSVGQDANALNIGHDDVAAQVRVTREAFAKAYKNLRASRGLK